ncbi:iron-sulfur cluster assembly accessory [Cordyceps militaris]|uniref:Iron-sulfur cluster assembly accessory n=1 Tax=Cordyceps militaris TaxID=73501 RepID=A0A2H4SM40_CORMI|nr:iron-sulfur cluster assembly accessory [Cordyceps militaris]
MSPLRCTHSFCSARAFVQLAKRRYTAAAAPTTATTSCLEFLAPRTMASPPRMTTSAARPLARRSAAAPVTISRREFSASAARSATTCVQNPVKDEDGHDMSLEITTRAAKVRRRDGKPTAAQNVPCAQQLMLHNGVLTEPQRLSEIMVKDGNPNLALRIQVESGGCHGFQYLMSLITIPQKDAADFATTVGEEDSIFQYVGEDPAVGAKYDGARIILDEPSLDLLKGSKVDFTMELIGSQFKIVDNPLATSSCGCGTSFDIKM